MNWKNTEDRYGRLSIAMHWLMLLLLVAVYTLIELRPHCFITTICGITRFCAYCPKEKAGLPGE